MIISSLKARRRAGGVENVALFHGRQRVLDADAPI